MVGLGQAGTSTGATSLAFVLFHLRNTGFAGTGGAEPFCFIDEVENDVVTCDSNWIASFDDHCLILSATGAICSADKSTDISTLF